jgi:Protein of unknown function (DUF2934)
MLKLGPDDRIIKLARKINELIARRTYELFESRGCTHGHDRTEQFRLRAVAATWRTRRSCFCLQGEL